MTSRGFFTVDLDVANNVGNELISAALVLDRELEETEKELSQGVVDIYTTFAPKRTLRLARSIKVRVGKSYFDVFITARDPISGYNYAPVTRFGHRVNYIYPKTPSIQFRSRTSRMSFFINTALSVHLKGGGVIFRHRVRGFKPASDWARDARPSIARLFNAKSDKFLEQTSRRVFSRLK